MFDKQNNPNTRVLLPGHYTLKTLAKTIENIFTKRFGVTIPTEIKQPNGAMIIYNMTGFGQEKNSPQETETDRGCVKLTCRKINNGVKERSYVGAVHLTTPIELVRW